jgi:hypothetical protein
MQPATGSKLSGTCTIMVTRVRPSSRLSKVMYSSPAMSPSFVVTTPPAVTFGPYSVPNPPPGVGSISAR